MNRAWALGIGLAAGCAPAVADVATRSVNLAYDVTVEGPFEGPLELWLPLPTDDAHQRVHDLRVETSIGGTFGVDATYGNRFWRGQASGVEGPVTVRVEARVTREVVAGPSGDAPPTAGERALFLGADRLVPVAGDLVARVVADLPPRGDVDSGRARDIFEYVVDNVEYKKVGTGWGNGSTEWACSARYGNCTDFHALFASMARAEGLPTRFHIGFPIPESEPSGEIAGYHCWVDVWTTDRGWLSIDASAAWKDRDHRDRWFGSLPADRVRVSTGRDLVLGQRGEPLNFFVYPYAEVAGKPHAAVSTRVSFRGR